MAGSNDYGITDEEFCGGTPDDEPYRPPTDTGKELTKVCRELLDLIADNDLDHCGCTSADPAVGIMSDAICCLCKARSLVG